MTATPEPNITRDAAQGLATFIRGALRPDWDVPGTTIQIGRAATTGRPPADVAHAAITAAATSTNRTPAVIPLPGPHWPPLAPGAAVNGPPCEDHPEEPARACRCCAADVKTGQRPPELIGKHMPPKP